MQHRSTIAVFSEWQRLALGRNIGFHPPQRKAISPRRLGRYLADIFFLEKTRTDGLAFRLAGTQVCALYGRELKNTQLLSLWPENSRPALAEMTKNVHSLQVPALSYHTGISISGRKVALEMFLAPLETGLDGKTEFIGSLAALENCSWIGVDPVIFGYLTAIQPIAPDSIPSTQQKTNHSSQHMAQCINASAPHSNWNAEPRQRPAPRLRLIAGGKL